jgi:ferric-dicitrate binding protein FerR (iron transport regulator)
MATDRFETLLALYQGGEAKPTEVEELESMLRADAALRGLFVERFLLEAHLFKTFSAFAPGEKVAVRPLVLLRRIGGGLAAAAVLLAIGALLLWPAGRNQALAHEVVAGRVAVGGVPTERIPDGAQFEVVSDTAAIISLPNGSEAELNPASTANIHVGDGQTIELVRGGGRFRVRSGERFRVNTPAGTVTALGTDFSVTLRPRVKQGNGTGAGQAIPALAVAVAAGTVGVDAGGQNYVVTAGQSRFFGDDGDRNQKDDGQLGQKDDGQANQKDDGQRNRKEDGQRNRERDDRRNREGDERRNQKDDGQQNQKDDGQRNQKDDGQANEKDNGQENQKDDGQRNQKNDDIRS